jgi:hypothetical protein
MNNQLERKVERDFLSPADDIFLGIVIEIAVVKRRRIKRIEQLLQLAQSDFNYCFRARDLSIVASVIACSFRRVFPLRT